VGLPIAIWWTLASTGFVCTTSRSVMAVSTCTMTASGILIRRGLIRDLRIEPCISRLE
jgi:hypothetical protein